MLQVAANGDTLLLHNLTLKLHIFENLKATLPIIATALASINQRSVRPHIRL